MKRHKIALIIIAVSVLLASLNFSTVPFSGGDNFAYFLLGKALAHGQGYIELWDANNTLHTKYPPMFPILLIPAGWFDSYLMAKWTVFLCYIIALWFVYRLFDTLNKNKHVTWIALSLFAFAPITIEYSSLVLSEIPYVMFSVIALYLFALKKYKWSIVFTVLTFLTRSIGITLIVAIVWCYYNKKEGRWD
jgi:Gpi18-like mannosyltransferase